VSNPGGFDHYVTVTANTNRGRTNLHTFGSWDDTPGEWFLMDRPSERQTGELSRALHPSRRAVDAEEPLARDRPLRVPAGDTRFGDMLAEGARVDLAPGVSPHGSTLAVVLEALRQDQRTRVDVADVKVVLSQLGSHITKLDSLTDEQTRHAAEAALYAEIRNRCTL
jgi:hypothetical protein